MAFCPECGTNTGNSKYCPNCGASQASSQFDMAKPTPNQQMYAPLDNSLEGKAKISFGLNLVAVISLFAFPIVVYEEFKRVFWYTDTYGTDHYTYRYPQHALGIPGYLPQYAGVLLIIFVIATYKNLKFMNDSSNPERLKSIKRWARISLFMTLFVFYAYYIYINGLSEVNNWWLGTSGYTSLAVPVINLIMLK